jgi:hypothetical protein
MTAPTPGILRSSPRPIVAQRLAASVFVHAAVAASSRVCASWLRCRACFR